MSRRAGLAGVLAVAMTAAALVWRDGAKASAAAPRAADCPERAGCADCHRGEMPTTHDRAFLADRHGDVALAQRASCAGCHAQSQCDACHAERAPLWHGPGVARPALDLASRRAHAEFGRARRADCLACHGQDFRAACAACHPATEFLR